MGFEKENKQANTTTIILIVVIIILIGVAVYLFLNYFPKKSQRTSPQTGTQTGTIVTETTQPTEAEGEPLPEKDAVGTKELGIVDRYPGSVIVSYSKDPDSGRTSVDYRAKASIDEVKNYYISAMGEEGWEMKGTSEDDISFVKGEDELYISFYFDEGKKTLKYYLEYISESV